MIVKHVPMRTVKKSDFSDLVKYLTDDQGKEHRIGDIQITNCASANLSGAIPEILATQRLNTRSNNDKTYHLIISFRAGENPSQEVLKAVEERVCSGLGFAEHQRISVVHRDTDNLHIHVAINKIHPQKNTILEPYKAYKKMAQLCTELEEKFGLEKDNHEQVQTTSENLANDMERHSGQESLVSWIRENCLKGLKAANSWKGLHQICLDHGLVLKKRGAGLIFLQDDIFVKASTVDRSLSKAALEKRLGEFEVSEDQSNKKPKKTYTAKPKDLDEASSNLYERYLQYNSHLNEQRPIRTKESKAKKSRVYSEAQRKHKLKVKAIKALSFSRAIKKILYRNSYRKFTLSTQSINRQYRQEQQELYQTLKKQTWVDWLKQEAASGNTQALKLLQAREKNNSLKGNVIYLDGATEDLLPNKKFRVDGISKKGSVVYRVGRQAVREHTNRLQLPVDATDFTILTAIDMALEKGGSISLSGGADFKAKVIKLSAYFNRKIRLKNNHFQSLKNKLEEEINHGRRTRVVEPRGRVGGGSIKGSGQRGSSGRVQGGYGRDPVQRENANSSSNTSKPNIGRIGAAPPPESRNRLRDLSELGLVYFTERSEVLLPSNVSRDMEQQKPEPTHRMRWDFSQSGITNKHIAAVNQYIEEREQKRKNGIDISKHTLYTDSHKEYSFAGIRNIDQFAIVLLEVAGISEADSTSIVELLPVDEATAKRLSRVKVGNRVTVTKKGLIRVKRGRSR